MKNWINQNKLFVLGMMVGSISGFCYWYFVGCSNGKCMIKSNPYLMSGYGGVLGGLFFSIIKKETK